MVNCLERLHTAAAFLPVACRLRALPPALLVDGGSLPVRRCRQKTHALVCGFSDRHLREGR